MKIPSTRITGHSLSAQAFDIHETEGEISLRHVQQLLQGELAAYRVKNYIPTASSEQIYHNFWTSPHKTTRPGYGEDGVEGYFIGASHIESSTEAYLAESEKFRQPTKDLFINTADPILKLKSTLSTSLYGCRAATHEHKQAGEYKAVYWNSLGPFLLQPHDDLAQLSDPLQKGFEIQSVKRVMAANLYVKVPVDGGQLKLWNVEPDHQSREQLNLTHSGFPYPPALLDEHPSLTIPVNTGDLCLINGNLIHAVLRGNHNVDAKNRLLLTFFSGVNDQDELIYWT